MAQNERREIAGKPQKRIDFICVSGFRIAGRPEIIFVMAATLAENRGQKLSAMKKVCRNLEGAEAMNVVPGLGECHVPHSLPVKN